MCVLHLHTHCTIYMHIKSLRDRSTSAESLQERDVGLHYNVIVGNAIMIIMLQGEVNLPRDDDWYHLTKLDLVLEYYPIRSSRGC